MSGALPPPERRPDMLGMLYAQEKLRDYELERALARNRLLRPAGPRRGPNLGRTLVGALARRAGRALRRLGAGLEAWGMASGGSAGYRLDQTG